MDLTFWWIALLQYHYAYDRNRHKCVLSFNYPLSAFMVTMVANNAVPSGLQHDILLAALSAYKKSPGIHVLSLHLVLCHNREKHGA